MNKYLIIGCVLFMVFVVSATFIIVKGDNTETQTIEPEIKIQVREMPSTIIDLMHVNDNCNAMWIETVNEIIQDRNENYVLRTSSHSGGSSSSGNAPAQTQAIVYAPTDFNTDGIVDYLDLGVWATCLSYYDKPYSGQCDFNNDGMLDYQDLGVWATHGYKS